MSSLPPGLLERIGSVADRVTRLETQEQSSGASGPCSLRWHDAQCYGAFGDWASHPVNTIFADYASASAVYPFMVPAMWAAPPNPSVEMDYLGIQAAINAAELGPVKHAYIPGGGYRLNWELVNDADGVTISGDGYNSHLMAYNHPDTTALEWLLQVRSAVVGRQIMGWTVRDLQLDGLRNTGGLCRRGLRVITENVDTPVHGRIEGLWVRDFYGNFGPPVAEGSGIMVLGTLGIPPARPAHYMDIVITNCHVYLNGENIQNSYAYGIGALKVRGVTISDCHSHSNGSGGIALWRASDITVTGCTVWDTLGPCYGLESCEHVIITGCLGESVDSRLPGPQVLRMTTLKIYGSHHVIVSGCRLYMDDAAEVLRTVYIFGGNLTSSQDGGPSTDILIENCEIVKEGDLGAAVEFDWWDDIANSSQRVQLRGNEIVNNQVANRHLAIYGNCADVEITDNHIIGGIRITGNASDVKIEGNKFECEYEALWHVIYLSSFDHIAVNSNEAVCDLANANVVFAFVRVASTCYYFQVMDNRLRGRLDYVLYNAGGGPVVYPSAHGNHIGGLTVDVAALGGTTYPPVGGTWPTGATIWCDFNGSGSPSSYSWNGAAWVAGPNW